MSSVQQENWADVRLGGKSDVLAVANYHDTPIATSDRVILILILGVAAILRFWGLGDIGLHGDEETMALPTLGILETGQPIMPSGMFYSRAVGQLYLMAASVSAFGVSEWALRFPSVIAGIVMVFFSYLLAQRFLPSRWALGAALVIALLPMMISQSQTARMYIFYTLFLTAFGVLVFRWERTESLVSLVAAFVAYLTALQFHSLSVLSSLIFLYPGLAQKSRRLFVQGVFAVAACGIAYFFLEMWITSKYFETVITERVGADQPAFEAALLQTQMVSILAVLVLSAIIWYMAAPHLKTAVCDPYKAVGPLVLLASTLAAASVNYHVAGIGFVVGTALFVRFNGYTNWLASFALFLGALFVGQFAYLFAFGGADGLRKVAVSMLATPTPRSYFQFADFFPLAMFIYLGVVAYFGLQFARGRPLPDHVLFFLVAVWSPLFVVAVFEDFPPPRYVVGFIPFFVVAAVAGFRGIWNTLRPTKSAELYGMALGTIALLAAFINPIAFWNNVNVQYSDFTLIKENRGADHKGAAAFIQGLDLGPADIIMAEDIIQQVYYLGPNMVDYRLRAFDAARSAAFDDTMGFFDIYTGTQQLGNVEMLAGVLEDPTRGSVFIIGSGETVRKPEFFLNKEMHELIQSYTPQVIYDGRDGHTKVWRISPPAS